MTSLYADLSLALSDTSHLDKNSLDELDSLDDKHRILTQLTYILRRRGRLPTWDDGTSENVAEHSYLLALLALRLKQTYYPLDVELPDDKIILYALFHDWPEILFDDVVTLGMTNQAYDQKAADEQKALMILLDFLERKGLALEADALRSYEAQSTKVARFIKAVDKITPNLVGFASATAQARYDSGFNTESMIRSSFSNDRQRFKARYAAEFPELWHEYTKYQANSIDQLLKLAAGNQA